MTLQEKAKIIIDKVDEKFMIPYYMEVYVIKGIMEALKEIEEKEENHDFKHEKRFCHSLPKQTQNQSQNNAVFIKVSRPAENVNGKV